MQIVIPPMPDKPEAEFEIVPDEVIDRSHGTNANIKLLFSKSNRVLIQDVFVQPFSENVSSDVFETLKTADIEAAHHRWKVPPEFKVVTTRLTCDAAPECRFTWVQIDFVLGSEDQADMRPIACAFHPGSQQDTIEITLKEEISGEATIKIAKVGSKESTETKVQQKQFNVQAAGAFSSEPSWTFSETKVNPEVTGDFTLMMIVACPQGIPSSAQVSIGATAQMRSGLIIPGLMRRKSENAAAYTFAL